MIWKTLALSLALAATPELQEVKKLDYSIQWAKGSGREGRAQRCFLRPSVAQALSSVQQQLKLVRAGLRLSRCYEPGNPQFGRGAAVVASVIPEDQPSNLLNRAMAAAGFREEKGVFIHSSWKKSETLNEPVEQLP